MRPILRFFVCAAPLILGCGNIVNAAETGKSTALPPPVVVEDGSILLTIFLRHDQSKPLPQIKRELTEHEFYKNFPPKGIQVVSWYVMMGIGQVVTLKVPAARLSEVNLAIENTAWGGFRTEFYPTYDYTPIVKETHYEALAK